MTLLEVRNLTKAYPGTIALSDANLRFEGGQVHALIGKNGAGKSTLVKILAGAVQPTQGQILIDGRIVRLGSPAGAFEQGIATVHQELSLAPELSVAENILLGRLPKRKPGPMIDWAETYRRARAILDDLQVPLDPRAKAGSLGVAQQQVIEIAKAMSFRPKVLLLDEPTSALALHETESLFRLIRQLSRMGVVIIHITHRLQELPSIADTVTVLRDGQCVGTIGIRDATPQNLVQMMFGQTVVRQRPPESAPSREPVLQVEGLSRGQAFQDISFTLCRGEILGIAGMLGSGRTELLRAIFGADPFDSGRILLEGRIVTRATPALMNRRGVALTPENRKEEALVQVLSTRANMCLAGLRRIAPHGFLTRRRERALVGKRIRELQIKFGDMEESVASLSGGNQQKVVIGNWLNTCPRLILFDEPTRGIDVQAKQQIFQIMWDLSAQGISCLVVSSELEELLEVCHRILIMRRGRLAGEVSPAEVTLDQIFAMCVEA